MSPFASGINNSKLAQPSRTTSPSYSPRSTGTNLVKLRTEAVNGLIEHLRGTARGFRNLHHYIARSLLDAGGFRPLIHSYL